jgi:hypothetical protein
VAKPSKSSAVFETKRTAAGRSALVVATCSAGKRCRDPVAAADLPKGPQPQVAEAWRQRLGREASLVRADRLYKGRAFSVVRGAAARIDADFGIVSAGLGYIDGATLVPGYDLNVRDRGVASVRARVTETFDPTAWWDAMKIGPFSGDLLVATERQDLVLVALSRPYLEMLANDLLAVVAARPGVLRLFGLSLAAAAPAALQSCVMPYDERLERLGQPGTRSDFAPRALAHFVEYVMPAVSETSDHAACVEVCLSQAPQADPRPDRRRGDDETLKGVIREIAQREGFRSGLVLRALRGSAGWACEQSRFMNLYRAVRAEAAA